MPRNMVSTISSVFAVLEQHASLRGSVVPALPKGAYRTIYGDEPEQAKLRNLKCVDLFRASSHLAMGLFQYGLDEFVGVMGFDFEPEVPELDAVDIGAGTGVVLLTEFKAAPSASPPNIVNVVGSASSADDGYEGHAFADIAGLFPVLQFFQVERGTIDRIGWPLLLKSATSEAAQGGSWVGALLQNAMYDLAGLEAREFPYPALCRAMFDLDPRSLFMALYRCVEATYARDACEKLRVELGLDAPWYELTAKLDRALGWRAPEAASINRTLEHADPADLKIICGCLGTSEADDMSVPAGRAIYKLRNNIVHFRAGDDQNYAAALDWDLLCTHLARVVREVYGSAFPFIEADSA